jgi:PUA domain protein
MGKMPQKHKRYFLKTKEAKTILRKASEKLNTDIELLFKDRLDVEVFQTNTDEIFLINGRPVLVKAGENIYPTLKFDEYFHQAPRVVVDMGAVPYVCKGANIMAPGIKRIEGEFSKNIIVSVVDEKHGKPIAVGEILYNAEEAKNVKQGIVVKNLYYVGDKTWNLLKELNSTPQ